MCLRNVVLLVLVFKLLSIMNEQPRSLSSPLKMPWTC